MKTCNWNMRAIVVLLASILCEVRTSAFTIPENGRKNRLPWMVEKKRTRRFSQIQSFEDQDVGMLDMATADKERLIESMSKLLARQQADIRITENILESLKSDYHIAALEKGTLSFAASIASGFDYGFVSRSEGANFAEIKGGIPGYGPPAGVWRLGWQQFWRNWDAMKGEYRDEEDIGKWLIKLARNFW